MKSEENKKFNDDHAVVTKGYLRQKFLARKRERELYYQKSEARFKRFEKAIEIIIKEITATREDYSYLRKQNVELEKNDYRQDLEIDSIKERINNLEIAK